MIAELHYPSVFFLEGDDKVKYNAPKSGYFMMQVSNKMYRDADPGITPIIEKGRYGKESFFYPLKISLGLYYDMETKITRIMITPLMVTEAFQPGIEAVVTKPSEINLLRGRPDDKILFHQSNQCLIYSPYQISVQSIIDTTKSLMDPNNKEVPHKTYTDMVYKLYDVYKRIKNHHYRNGVNVDDWCTNIQKGFITVEKIVKKALGTTYDNEAKVAMKMLQNKLYGLATEVESLFLYR